MQQIAYLSQQVFKNKKIRNIQKKKRNEMSMKKLPSTPNLAISWINAKSTPSTPIWLKIRKINIFNQLKKLHTAR
jgi:hypothetical protein